MTSQIARQGSTRRYVVIPGVRSQAPGTSVETTADCSIEKQGEGWKITRIALRCRVAAPGVDPAKFQSIAQATKEGCPVSTALKGNVQIELDAQLL